MSIHMYKNKYAVHEDSIYIYIAFSLKRRKHTDIWTPDSVQHALGIRDSVKSNMVLSLALTP